MKAFDSKEEQARLKRRIESALRLEAEKQAPLLQRLVTEFTARALFRERELTKVCNVCGAKRRPWGGPK